MVVGTDVLVMAIFHPETTGNYAQLDKSETFVEMPCVNIAGNNGIKLQDAESMKLSLNETVRNQFFADMKASCLGADRIAGVTDMTAPANIIRMKNVKSQYFAIVCIFSYSSVRLCCEKFLSGLRV